MPEPRVIGIVLTYRGIHSSRRCSGDPGALIEGGEHVKRARILALLVVSSLLASVLAGTTSNAAPAPTTDRQVAISGSDRAEDMTPRQPGPNETARILAAATTTESQCIDSTDTLVLTVDSFDPNHPGSQDVVFHRETPAGAPGRARIWVAWDFLASEIAGPDEIACDQVAQLQGDADQIIETDVHYFGDYQGRGPGGKNIDILTYNVVDEAYYDPDAPSFIAGFYSSFYQEQFDRNIFFLDSALWDEGLGADAPDPFLVEGVFAHELEHLIMNDHDADELSWIDEGLAELAIYLNGYADASVYTSSIVYFLAFHREDSLTMWGSQLWDYGASSLFQLYLLENFGTRVAPGTRASAGSWDPAWTRRMVNEQANGIAGVEQATGEDFDTLFDAWILANLQDKPNEQAAGGYPMGYREVDTNPIVDAFLGPWSIRRSLNEIYPPPTNDPSEAPPYSAVYAAYRDLKPRMSIRFRGDAVSGVAAPEGTMEAYSGVGPLMTDRTLALDAPVGGTLTFQTWFNIEEEWDYGFVEASTDGGATWEPLEGSITRTSTNPNGSTAWANALGTATSTDAAITGSSGGWVDATFDLPAATGVLVRFNYYTDEAFEELGWYIDDVQVNGFADGFESGAGDWSLGGWEITDGLLANDWIGAFINPIKGHGFEAGYLDGTVGAAGNERFSTVLDTHRAGHRRIIVVIANRPEVDAADNGFPAGYRRVVREV